MADSTEKSKSDFHTDMPVGEILRRGREHFGQSLEDVERNLRIRAIQLHALETGNIEQLPGKAYALGFVRSYSEYLGLDGEKMVQLFKRQSLGNKIEPNLHFPTPASESKLPGMAFAAVLALIGVGLIWWWMSSYAAEDRTVVAEVPAVAETSLAPSSRPSAEPVNASTASPSTGAVSGMPATAEGASSLPTQQPITVAEGGTSDQNPIATTEQSSPAAEQPAGAGNNGNLAAQEMPAAGQETAVNGAEGSAAAQAGIILNIKENSWVEIRDTNGKALVSRVLKAGDQYYVPDRPDLRMSLGNASGIEIVVEGTALPALGARGEVIRNVALDAKSLKSLAQR